MKYRFNSREQVLQSPLFDFGAPCGPLAFTDRCTRGTHLDDMIFRDLHSSDDAGNSLTRDVFQMLYTHEFRQTEPGERTVRGRELYGIVLSALTRSEKFPAFKEVCEGHDRAAYEAATMFASEMTGQLDELKRMVGKLLAVLNKLEARNRMAAARLRRLVSQQGNDGAVIAEAVEAASTGEQLRAVTRILRDKLRLRRAETAGAVAAAMRKAADAAEFVRAAALCWGDAAGENQKGAYDTALMERVRASEKLRAVTRQLGRMKELLSDLRKNAYAYGRGEKYSLTLGRDLKNVLSAELGLLAAPETRPLFFKKYNTKSLRQYARRDMVRKGGGDIIVCLDESSSMSGENEVWSKALALALQDICAHERRKFALIHFANAGEVKTDLFLPDKYGAVELMRAAEHFFGGGTDFEAPMREALRVMDGEGFQDADIVFITDGACSISDDFAEELQAAQEEKHCTVIGLLVDQDEPGMAFSLERFCERTLRLSEMTEGAIEHDLLSGLIA